MYMYETIFFNKRAFVLFTIDPHYISVIVFPSCVSHVYLRNLPTQTVNTLLQRPTIVPTKNDSDVCFVYNC